MAILLCAHSLANAQATAISVEHHPWNRFAPGAWAKVRKQTEEFDEKGNVRSVDTTETRTVLVDVGDERCAVQLEVTIEVAGKRITGQPRIVSLGRYGEANGELATVQRLRSESVDTGGVSVDCDVLEATILGKEKQVVSTIWYNQTTPPFVLKRSTKSTDKEGKQVHETTREDLIAAEMPYNVFGKTMSAAYFRTIETRAAGSTVTFEVRCIQIPGGVVAHSSKQLDDSGKMISRSTLELLAYGFEDPPQPAPRRPFLFRGNRRRRSNSTE